ncbi:hypothetical protein F5888DRAFT_1078249 [Russula emetica]|nr:hypothetical protein F5888DRAFT_1078249 [Russula emetica]
MELCNHSKSQIRVAPRAKADLASSSSTLTAPHLLLLGAVRYEVCADALIHSFDPTASCDPVTFQPCSDRQEICRFVSPCLLPEQGSACDRSCRNWAISRGCIFGGNPWYLYLATLAVAEQLYDALLTWDTLRAIEVMPISQAFVAQVRSTLTTYSRLSAAIRTYADGFLAIVARHIPPTAGSQAV